MDNERTSNLPEVGLPEPTEPAERPPGESARWASSQMSGPPPKATEGGSGLQMARIVLGAVIAFVVMSLLYGPIGAMATIAFAVICTAGLSLILIIPGCWLVGWVATSAWEAIQRQRAAPRVP